METKVTITGDIVKVAILKDGVEAASKSQTALGSDEAKRSLAAPMLQALIDEHPELAETEEIPMDMNMEEVAE